MNIIGKNHFPHCAFRILHSAFLLLPFAALAWNPGGHVWNGAAGDNDLDNAANWVTNKTDGGFSTTKFKVDTPPGPNDVAVFPYGNYNFTLPHDYDWGILYLGGYGTAANKGDFILDLNGHTLTVSNKSTVAGMATSTGAGACATNFVFRNGSVVGFKAVNPGSKRTWSFIDCPSLSLGGTDWGPNAGAIYVDNSKMTLSGSMRFGRGLRFAVSNRSEVVSTAFGYHGSQGSDPGDNHVLVTGTGTTFTCTGDLKLTGTGNSVRILDGASATGSMLGLRTGVANPTNFLFEVRNASLIETGNYAQYRGHLGCSATASGCQIIFDHPVAFSIPTDVQMLGVSNSLFMSGSVISNASGVVTFGGRDNKMTLDDWAFVRTSNGSFNFSGATRPSLTISGGAWFESSTNIVNRPVCYTNATDVAIRVADGGQALIWASPFSIDGTNTVVSVSNGTFHVMSCWASGSCSITPLGAGFGFQSTFDCWRLQSGGLPWTVHSPAVELAGKDAKFLVTGRFRAGREAGEDGAGQHPAELRFTVPPEGWGEAPFAVEESIDSSLATRKNGELRIRDEVVFRVDARPFISANRYAPAGRNTRVVPLVRGVTNLTGKAKLKYTYEADVEALNDHAALLPANRLRLVDHLDGHGNVVGIDLEIAYEKGLKIFLQ